MDLTIVLHSKTNFELLIGLGYLCGEGALEPFFPYGGTNK